MSDRVKAELEDAVVAPFTSTSTTSTITVTAMDIDVNIKDELSATISTSHFSTLDGFPKSHLSLTPNQAMTATPTPTSPPTSVDTSLQDGKSTDGTTSKAATPPFSASIKPTGQGQNSKRPPVVSEPQLIGDLPVSREEALASFNEIPENIYQYKTLGRSRELLESMTCDCTYEHGVDSEDMACGPYSDCINRLTQVECLSDDCRCRSYCKNQRFQRKEYANMEIVLTEKKGYGLRAEEDIPKDTFIYEYVGDVVNTPSFRKRMREYAREGIQHFYFMMLQKDEFIDATKNGGIGRFANHSCNPNCYVAKWAVGEHVRMGIFAKRTIKKHEELTFNYNVDRYGHQAQVCYCGEPNCVGFIGGKTQTEFATMDDLYLDALGITDEFDLLELKGTKKKKGKKIDDPDFMPTMKPVVEKDVPKVVQAIRQTTNRKVLYKILTRIKMTEDQAALRQLMRLRGYSLMTNVLNDYKTDLDLTFLAMECMSKWPLLNKNKVEDSQVYVPVGDFARAEDEKVRKIAQKLLDHWNTLPTYNRIPKRLISAVDPPDYPERLHYDGEEDDFTRRERELKRARQEEEEAIARRLRAKARVSLEKLTAEKLAAADWGSTPLMDIESDKSSRIPSPKDDAARASLRRQIQERQVQAIITSVVEAKAAEEAAAAAEEAERKERMARLELERTAKEKERERRRKERKEREKERGKGKERLTEKEKEAVKEKRLLKLVGAVVVKSMSKYAKGLGKEDFKKYAKELTHLIAEKEKKSTSYKENRLESLSEEKIIKIKKFSKDYIAKLLRKLEKTGKSNFKHHSNLNHDKGKGRMSSAFNATNGQTPSTSLATPNSVNHDQNRPIGNIDDGDEDRTEMTVEEAMDLDSDPEPGDEVDYEDDYAEQDGDQDVSINDGPMEHPDPVNQRLVPPDGLSDYQLASSSSVFDDETTPHRYWQPKEPAWR